MTDERSGNIKRLPDGSIDCHYYTICGAQARSEQFSTITSQMSEKWLQAAKSLPAFVVATILYTIHHPPGN